MFLCYSLLTTPASDPKAAETPTACQSSLLLGEQGGRRINHAFMEVEVSLSVFLHLPSALPATPTMHSRTFPVYRQ